MANRWGRLAIKGKTDEEIIGLTIGMSNFNAKKQKKHP